MAKFSGTQINRSPMSAVKSVPGGTVTTFEGGLGYRRTAESDLFLLAVSNLVATDTFYESGSDRDDRMVKLVRQVVKENPAFFLPKLDGRVGFVKFLRDTMQMRSASVVVAAEYAAAGGPQARQVVADAISRADEPAELLAYWYAKHGRKLPAAVKRGIADGIAKTYNEFSALRYDSTNHDIRMADVIALTRPRPRDERQSELFTYLGDKRHKRDNPRIGENLSVIQAERAFNAVPEKERRDFLRKNPTILKDAGISWERLSGWLPGGMDAEAWESLINADAMGYMALLRNLRNFDQAGVSYETKQKVVAKLTDPEEVAKSRQFPIRFFSAYNAVSGLDWASALERALDLSCANIPELRGKSLILVDVSSSMIGGHYGKTEVEPWQVASVFGAALARRGDSDLYAYSTSHSKIDVNRTSSVLRTVEKIRNSAAFYGGTNTFQTVNATYAGQDRIIILTDEQAFYSRNTAGSITKPIYTFNLNGYAKAQLPSGDSNRHSFGGLTDQAFKLLELLEAGKDAGWPF